MNVKSTRNEFILRLFYVYLTFSPSFSFAHFAFSHTLPCLFYIHVCSFVVYSTFIWRWHDTRVLLLLLITVISWCIFVLQRAFQSLKITFWLISNYCQQLVTFQLTHGSPSLWFVMFPLLFTLEIEHFNCYWESVEVPLYTHWRRTAVQNL